jgi:GxxExxY protein
MPIEPTIPIAVISKDEFHAIHKVMLGHAFDIHNDFGRLLDESIYKAELADRCLKHGFDTKREVLIRVRHQSFTKEYFIDLLLCGSTVIEAKTAKNLTDAHRGQGINYLLLAGTHHGSLVNFRPTSVGREFLSTHLSHSIRSRFEVHDRDWPRDNDHAGLRHVASTFCADVGIGLDLPLYREAFASLLGIKNPHLVPIISGDRKLGHHEMYLLNEETGLAVTALADTKDYRTHLQRLLSITTLKSMAWVNLRIGHIELIHLKRQNHGG